MKATSRTDSQRTSTENVITLPDVAPRLGRIAAADSPVAQPRRQRFRILDFANASGSRAYRVQGMTRSGEYVRRNFSDLKAAQCYQVELEAEFHKRATEDSTIRATKLTDAQLRIAESAFLRLEQDEDLLFAVNYWFQHGRNRAIVVEAPRLDDAVAQFQTWLASTDSLRKITKDGLRIRVKTFASMTGNPRLDTITADTLEEYLAKRKVSSLTRDNDKRALSRFFRWCIERPRRWITSNPCREVRVEKPERQPPAVLDVEVCEKLLRAAEKFKEGRLAPYVAVALFAGLRPFEIVRLTWKQINLPDGEIRLEAHQTKTGKPRVVSINKTLCAWLSRYKEREIFPANWLKDFRAVRQMAGIQSWPADVARHTSVSHFFRLTGSYGRTAEEFGNSESIIKAHYQGRVTSQATKRFYRLRPQKKP